MLAYRVYGGLYFPRAMSPRERAGYTHDRTWIFLDGGACHEGRARVDSFLNLNISNLGDIRSFVRIVMSLRQKLEIVPSRE